jgi:hypothetical protein
VSSRFDDVFTGVNTVRYGGRQCGSVRSVRDAVYTDRIYDKSLRHNRKCPGDSNAAGHNRLDKDAAGALP